MEKFKVGDKVQVVDPGRTYTTFTCMFEKMGFRYIYRNELFQQGLIATVFAISEHETDSDITLLGLEAQNGTQCLMSTKGVVKVITTSTLDDKFDIIREFCDEVLSSEGIEDKVIFKYLLNKNCK